MTCHYGIVIRKLCDRTGMEKKADMFFVVKIEVGEKRVRSFLVLDLSIVKKGGEFFFLGSCSQ